jgi:tetratricopeptide (TPR) repeat protein
MERAGEVIHEPVVIPQITLNPSRFNTTNLQEEIVKGMQQIMEATEKETVVGTMDNIKKIAEEIPYLQLPTEEELAAKEAAYEAATVLLDEKQFEEAFAVFTELGDFKDSAAKLAVAEIGLKMQDDYNAALAAMEQGDYAAAMVMWKQLGDHLDCPQQYAICGAELEKANFRTAMDSEIPDYAAAEASLEAMT